MPRYQRPTPAVDRIRCTDSTASTASAGEKVVCRARQAEARVIPADPLLNARDAAAETGRAISTFWRDVRRGTMAPAIYVLPRSPRWRLSELRAVVNAAPRSPRGSQ